jgi:hypothetical protein
MRIKEQNVYKLRPRHRIHRTYKYLSAFLQDLWRFGKRQPFNEMLVQNRLGEKASQ